MSVLWVLPLLFAAAGALVLWAAVRQTADAAAALRAECARLDELRTALVALQGETDLARAKIEQMRPRSEARPFRR